MPKLRDLELDAETFERLVARAAAERRPIPWQAEVIIRRALGLPFPYEEVSSAQQEPNFATR